MTRSMRLRCMLSLAFSLLLVPGVAPAGVAESANDDMSAQAASPQPFSARYRLEVSGWPNATIDHQLIRESGHWQSRMKAAIAVARGNERSRFVITPEGARSVNYASGYSLLGIGGDYRLGSDDLADRPDRQTALFELSRRAVNGDCRQGAECRLVYQDHRGREEILDYRVLDREHLQLPAGEFDAVKVEVIDRETPDRQMIFHFHPELPGLLLAVDYRRDGKRSSRLSLTSLDVKSR
ncbi:hypothetical protein [Billgrantia endophytica]|uniref:DUF3108 domain-containing protein n=1 Tax=Billgrantia endophytica TaxID=2033802 RepID=A0A2N7TYI1_9GAMM|nr:hypothetical protein [Halomonas endophytica]PMR73241.1 hypothetical protein C1H69_18030 [Halomonas endophytica]